jgi:hypothetical protein
MRLFVNILKWISIVIIALAVILTSLSFMLHDKLIDIFISAINKEITTPIKSTENNLSFLKRFPRASVELKNVVVLSSKGIDKNQFPGTATDTLLFTPSATLEFSIIDIFKGTYNIETLIIERGSLTLLSDSLGNINYDISADSPGGSSDDFVIDLRKIIISSLETRYINKATELEISGMIDNGRFKTRIWGDNIDFISNASFNLKRFDLYSVSLRTNASLGLDLNLQQSDSGIIFRKGSLTLEDFKFGLTGYIGSDDMLALKITGQNIDLNRIKKYLPEKFLQEIIEYSPSGILKTECNINGYISRLENPLIKIGFSVENGSITYSKSNIRVSDLSFYGIFTNGEKRGISTSSFALNNLELTLGSSHVQGRLMLQNFSDPSLNITVSGDIFPSEMISFISIPEIIQAGGSFHFNLNLSGKLPEKDKFSATDFIGLNPEAVLDFNSFGIEHKDRNYSFSDVDGIIMVAKNLWAEELVFEYKGQRIKINGEFINLPAWIAGRPVRIKAMADVSADYINPLFFMEDSSSNKPSAGRAYKLPSGIEADINFRFDNLEYRRLTAGRVSGKFLYRPGVAEFKNLLVNALDGTARGNIFIAQNSSLSFLTQGDFKFEGINVKRAFTSFNNFGQSFIRDENIEGRISGNLDILMPADSSFRPDVKSIAADGKYIIENGRLIDFEPVKELSRFIELSELEDISFSRLENDLLIRNNYLATPQMDIRSSAADFSVNGSHSFDLNYEYHVKTYLSEILSKKAKKNSKTSSEFGAVEDDGLGRTSIYLKITGNAEETKVSYDMKAAGNNVKQSLKNERSMIKSILNEEYGWFKGDSAVKQETAPKPKFKIEFSETDTTSAVKDTPAKTEEKGFPRIFRRKKGS